MNRLDGKVAFISGAARGIGAATARLMVEAGAKVAIGDVLDERGRETAQAIAGAGDAAIYLHLDVTREDEWTAVIAATVTRFGGLDILVNNAGLFLGKGIEEASLAEWQRLCAVNLTGCFSGPNWRCRHCAIAPGRASMAAPSSISPRLPGSSARKSTRSIR